MTNSETVVTDEWGDEVADELADAGLDCGVFVQAYELFVQHQILTVRELARMLGVPPATARTYVQVLMKADDVYPSVGADTRQRTKMYYCYAPAVLAALCRRRKISLARFLRLAPLLDRFMLEAEEYYLHRLQDDRTGRTRMSKLKRQYVRRLQPKVSPGIPLDRWRFPISAHPAWRYVRTAQDLVLLKLDVPRPFLDHVAGVSRRVPAHSLVVDAIPHGGMGEAAAATAGKVMVKCADCGAERAVNKQDAFQVRRCIRCQARRRGVRAQLRNGAVKQLGRALSTRGTSRQEANTTPKDKEKPKTVTIKCKDCGKERVIKPQDVFQVKRCADHQKEHRLKEARERRKSRSKAKPKNATKREPKPKKTPAPAPPAETGPAAALLQPTG